MPGPMYVWTCRVDEEMVVVEWAKLGMMMWLELRQMAEWRLGIYMMECGEEGRYEVWRWMRIGG